MRSNAKISLAAACTLTALTVTSLAVGGAHTWDVWEVFSNSDGTIQFVELRETGGGNAETGIAGHIVSSAPSGGSHTISTTPPATTANKSFLIGTVAFAALPGAPPVDETLPDNFLDAFDSSVTYSPYDTGTWTSGLLPTDGYYALSRVTAGGPLVRRPNTPRNYATTQATVNTSGNLALPAVSEGGVFGQPMRASRVTADGSAIQITFDTAACPGEMDQQIIYGQRSGFPGTAGGVITPLGGRCDIGTATPFVWNPTRTPDDGSNLMWFLIVTEDNAGTEGPWGSYNNVTERTGPGANGSSGVCGTTNKDVTNLCGH